MKNEKEQCPCMTSKSHIHTFEEWDKYREHRMDGMLLFSDPRKPLKEGKE
jgi:hypothetical protein